MTTFKQTQKRLKEFEELLFLLFNEGIKLNALALEKGLKLGIEDPNHNGFQILLAKNKGLYDMSAIYLYPEDFKNPENEEEIAIVLADFQNISLEKTFIEIKNALQDIRNAEKAAEGLLS